MTSDSGSIISGLSQTKCGLSIVDRPDVPVYRFASHRIAMETAMKTVLITGCSSGYGLETARHFHAAGLERHRHHAHAARGLLPRPTACACCRST